MNTYPLPTLRTFHSSHQARDKWQALKILEEASETVEAAKACINTNPTDTRGPYERKQALADEIADLLQTIVNLCDAYMIDPHILARSADTITKRNIERGMFTDGERTRMHRAGECGA